VDDTQDPVISTVILCGGRGTRAYPYTVDLPKPLLEVDGRPILARLMSIYAAQGFTDFVLAGGFRVDKVSEFAATCPTDWRVEVVDTGEATNTGGRVRLVQDHVAGETFFVTYGDGLGNVDLRSLLEFHRSHDGLATLTTVPLPSQYGTIDIDEAGRVNAFREKPLLPDHLINAGFFVFDEAVFVAWAGEDLERDVLPALGARGQLFAYRHDGYWKSMDTYKDAQDLSELCRAGVPPWEVAPVSP
jgi:glucose-1-phosphate cytidylyltransferase